MKPKIFVSCFQISFDFEDEFDLCHLPEFSGLRMKAVKFIELLQKHGYDVTAPLMWTNYTTIEGQIDGSDCFVALVDEAWFSSTWKCSELTYAADGFGAFRHNPDHKKLPVFLYYLDDVLDTWLESPEYSWISLSLDPVKALETIKKHLPCSP